MRGCCFSLELGSGFPYFRFMKPISFLIVTLALWAPSDLRAQDAATEERLNKLSGQIEDLMAARTADQKRISELSRELESVREQPAKPTANYATQEELKRLAEAVKEIDRKRLEDYDKIRAEILKLGKTLSAPLAPPKKNAPATPSDSPVSDKPVAPEKGFEYVIQPGDTLSVIVQAYREKNVKVTVDQILKANPGLKPDKLRPGQKIFIPAPQP